MAQRLQILIDGEDLDLAPGAEQDFYITRQVHDLRNLETRNADYTKQVVLPTSRKNIAKLGDPTTGALVSLPKQPTRRLECEIRLDGVTITPVAFLAITESDKDSFKGSLFFGNFNLFDILSDRQLADLDLSDLDFSFTPGNLKARANNTSDLVAAIADWIVEGPFAEGLELEPPTTTDRKDWIRAVSARESGVFIYCKDLLTRIVSAALPGYSIDAGTLEDFNEWNNLALAIPVQQFTPKASGEGDPVSGQVAQDTTQVEYDGNGTAGAAQRVTWETVISDPDSFWSALNDEFTVGTPSSGVYQLNLSVQMIGRYINEGGPFDQEQQSRIRLVSNRGGDITILDEVNITQVGGIATFKINLERELWLATANEKFYVEILMADRSGSAGDRYFFIPNANNFFKLEEVAQFTPTNVSISDWIPELGQADFLKGLLQMFNVVPFIDEVDRTLILRRWDRIVQNQAQDLSDKIDISGATKVETFFSRYGRTNWFRYAEDKTLDAPEDADLAVPFQSEILEEEADLVTLPFAASDPSIFFLLSERDGIPLARIPVYEREAFQGEGATVDIVADAFLINFSENPKLKRGDYIRLSEEGYTGAAYMPNRITSVAADGSTATVATAFTASTTGANTWKAWRISEEETDAPRVVLIQDKDPGLTSDLYIVNGDASETATLDPGVDDWKEATFADSLRFGTPGGLVQSHYARLIEALENPVLIRAFFVLSPADFQALDFFRPVYISAFNAYFYLNKVEQYKPGKPTRIELFRIGAVN